MVTLMQNEKQQILKGVNRGKNEIGVQHDFAVSDIDGGSRDYVGQTDMSNEAPEDREGFVAPEFVEILIHDEVVEILLSARKILGPNLHFDRIEVCLTFYCAHVLPIGIPA
jgi:hypothetical protein